MAGLSGKAWGEEMLGMKLRHPLPHVAHKIIRDFNEGDETFKLLLETLKSPLPKSSRPLRPIHHGLADPDEIRDLDGV